MSISYHLDQLSEFHFNDGAILLANGTDNRLGLDSKLIPYDAIREVIIRSFNQNPCLFMEFAGVEPTADAFDCFWRKKILPESYSTMPTLWTSGLLPVEGRHFNEAKSLSLWQNNQVALRRCIAIMNALKNRNLDYLSDRIVWEGDGLDSAAYFRSSKSSPNSPELILSNRNMTPGLVDLIYTRDVWRTAYLYVQVVLNIKIKEHTIPWISLQGTADRSSLQHCSLKPEFIPFDLFGCLWLQFADAFSEMKTFRRCETCGKMFEVQVTTTWNSRKFCGTNCKAKSHEVKKRRASELSQEGKSIEEIAIELKTKSTTVKSWITAAAKRKKRHSNDPPPTYFDGEEDI